MKPLPNHKLAVVRCLLGVAALMLIVTGSGCATDGDRDYSSRPWNTPRNWEHGLPSGMYEGR